MPPRKRKPGPASSDLRRTITLTLEADEDTLNRLAAVLLFARYPHLDKTEERAPVTLPWEEPGEAEPLPVVDPVAMREEIATLLQRYINKHGVELARRLLAEYEAGKLSEIPEHRLGDVLADLQRSLAVRGNP